MAPACRSPRSGGSRRRRGRALRACDRINRSIRCKPLNTPSQQPGSIGAVAAKEAGTHFGTELLVSAAAAAARPCHPRIEATPRDTERLAHPQHWPYPSVLRDEAELHVDSFAK